MRHNFFNKLSKSKPLQPQLSSSCQGDEWLRGLSNDCIWRARQLAGLGGCLVKVIKVVSGLIKPELKPTEYLQYPTFK